MKRSVVVLLFLSFAVWFMTPAAFGQSASEGIEKFRVAVDAPDFTLREPGTC